MSVHVSTLFVIFSLSISSPKLYMTEHRLFLYVVVLFCVNILCVFVCLMPFGLWLRTLVSLVYGKLNSSTMFVVFNRLMQISSIVYCEAPPFTSLPFLPSSLVISLMHTLTHTYPLSQLLFFSVTGKKLMAKCRSLMQENQELGKQISQGRVAQLEAEVALQRKFNDEIKASQDGGYCDTPLFACNLLFSLSLSLSLPMYSLPQN